MANFSFLIALTLCVFFAPDVFVLRDVVLVGLVAFLVALETFLVAPALFLAALETFLVAPALFLAALETFLVAPALFLVALETFLVAPTVFLVAFALTVEGLALLAFLLSIISFSTNSSFDFLGIVLLLS